MGLHWRQLAHFREDCAFSKCNVEKHFLEHFAFEMFPALSPWEVMNAAPTPAAATAMLAKLHDKLPATDLPQDRKSSEFSSVSVAKYISCTCNQCSTP